LKFFLQSKKLDNFSLLLKELPCLMIMRLTQIFLPALVAVNLHVEASLEADSLMERLALTRVLMPAVVVALAVNHRVEASPEADSIMERILNSWQSLRNGFLDILSSWGHSYKK
jgi:hypothetical protein